MTGRTLAAAASALGLAATVAACANLPTSGTVQVSNLHGTGGTGATGVQVVPKPPQRGWRPLDIVNGFLTASASYSYDPRLRVARQYLTKDKNGFGHGWRPGWKATIVDTPKVGMTAPPLGGRATEQGSGQQQVEEIQVTGKHVSTLATAGRYQAGTVVALNAKTKFDFFLVQVRGQWRINEITVDGRPAKPTLLLISNLDFALDYQARNLYFYPAGPATEHLVSDPVYIPAQAGKQGIHGLVQTLLVPPPDASWLFGAAQTAFPPGTKILSAQVVGGITAVVNLGGTAAKASPSEQQRMAAQLDMSLRSQPYASQGANPIASVVLKLNGRSVKQPAQGYASWVPRQPPRPMYYQVAAGSLGAGGVAVRARASKTGSVPLPKALAGRPFTAMAVSTAQTGSAVTAGCRGTSVYLMPQGHAGRVITGHVQGACRSLSFDSQGYLWVATKTAVYVIKGAGSDSLPHPAVTSVLGPSLGNAKIEALRVAPDGVRVALLLRDGPISKIRIAAISEGNGQTYVAQTSNMLRVGTDVPDPVGLSWLDADHLLVLDRTGHGRTELFEVPLNGGQSTPVATPHGVTSVTASWPGHDSEPTIAVCIGCTDSSPGVIQMSNAALLNPDWQQVAKGTTPVFPG